MYVCVCNAITENDIRGAINDGANCMNHLRDRLNITNTCGCCADAASECLDRHLAKQMTQDNLLSF